MSFSLLIFYRIDGGPSKLPRNFTPFDIELRTKDCYESFLFFSFLLSLSMVSPLMELEEEEILRG